MVTLINKTQILLSFLKIINYNITLYLNLIEKPHYLTNCTWIYSKKKKEKSKIGVHVFVEVVKHKVQVEKSGWQHE